MKTCTRCGVEKSLSEYHRMGKREDGSSRFRANCKACHREYSAQWRAKNRDRARETNAQWRAENRDRKRETDAQWYAKNRDREREKRTQWRAKNRDRAYENDARRRARKNSALSEPYARAEIFDAYENMCVYCRTEVTPDTGHLDHILPLSRGGVDMEMNLAPACPPCNLSKNAKTLMEWLGNSFNTDKDGIKQ